MFFPKCYVTLSKQETNTKSVFLKMIYSYSSHSVGSLAMSHNNVTISNPSSAGGSAIQQKSRDLQVRGFAHICRENATSRSKALPQKNMNESLRHDMFQNEMFSRVFAFKKCIYFLNKYTLCFFTTTTCTKFPRSATCGTKEIEPSTRNSFHSLATPISLHLYLLLFRPRVKGIFSIEINP